MTDFQVLVVGLLITLNVIEFLRFAIVVWRGLKSDYRRNKRG